MDRLPPGEARALIRRILESGTVTYSKPHAIERLEQRKMTMLDVENVLRGGRVSEPEWENGGWRYQVFTNKFCVIVELLAEDHLLVVSGWRLS